MRHPIPVGLPAKLRIERATGERRLAVGRVAGGGFREGFAALPEDSADPSQCPEVNPLAVLNAVAVEFDAEGVVASVGLGPCGDAHGDYDTWNMSVNLFDWKHDGLAVQRVAERMKRHDIRGYVGVGVTGVPCAEADIQATSE